MAAKMPGSAPTRTADSIGQEKRDRQRAPNFTEYVPAGEWNNLCDEVIEVSKLLLNLAAVGATGTLQQIYNNGQNGIILLDAVRKGIIIKDVVGNPIGTELFQILNSNGASIVSFTGTTGFTVSSNGTGIATDLPNGAIKLVGTGGRDFNPSENENGSLGNETLPFRWKAVHALKHASKSVIVAFAASPVFNCSLGEVQQVTLTGNMTTFSFTNMSAGQHITCVFTQDATGGRKFTGAVPANVFLADGGTNFSLNYEVNASMSISFRRDTVTNAIWETGRSYSLPPVERRYRSRTLSNVSIDLNARIDEKYQMFTGILTGPINISLLSEGSVGDEFVIDFGEAGGLVTTNVNQLSILSNGSVVVCDVSGSGVSTFAQNKTLRGRIHAVKTTAVEWYLSFIGALTYT